MAGSVTLLTPNLFLNLLEITKERSYYSNTNYDFEFILNFHIKIIAMIIKYYSYENFACN